MEVQGDPWLYPRLDCCRAEQHKIERIIIALYRWNATEQQQDHGNIQQLFAVLEGGEPPFRPNGGHGRSGTGACPPIDR